MGARAHALRGGGRQGGTDCHRKWQRSEERFARDPRGELGESDSLERPHRKCGLERSEAGCRSVAARGCYACLPRRCRVSTRVSRMRRTPTQEVLAGPQRSMDSVASAVRTARPMEYGDVERTAMDQLRSDRWDPIA
jgi:hypothetical protein